MSTQIQQMLNIQSIGIFHGLRFEVKVAQRFLEEVLGSTSFHKNLPKKFHMLQEKNKILEQFKSQVGTEFDSKGFLALDI
eukprot:snap_masked-scaffold_7-processed-gene-10.34-mRNA-1 protein AED:1.00 eAED:1.00 QI:0/0/0/0/1/1/2/0/79